MYRRPKFLEVLLQIREQMARDADYDVDRFAEMVRSGNHVSSEISLTDQVEPAVVAKMTKHTATRRKVKEG
ncbi:MAG: hypothetical protein ACREO5_09065 [Candidatus Binatia bacterium]